MPKRRETNDKTWMARGAESKVSVEKLARLASTCGTFRTVQTYLLQAEEQFTARRKYKSLQYFCQAEEKYRDWLAVTKADELANYLRSN
eukprot:scaffold15235_cov74-Skeletonema_menzelii.AAC.1